MPIIRNLRKDLNEGRMDELRSVTYAETGVQSPFVTKNILNPPKERGILLQADKRADDLVRISKLFINKPGIKYLGNEALLKQENLTKKLQGLKNQTTKDILRDFGGTAKHVTQVVASTLAQVPVNGTGTHFVKGFRADTYLQDNIPRSDFAEFFGGGGVQGSQFALSGKPVSSKSLISKSQLPNRNTTITPGTIGVDHIGIQGKLTSITDISAYNNSLTYYSTAGTFSPSTTKGIVFPTSDSKFIQTATVPGELGLNKTATGAEQISPTGGEPLKVTENPSLILNTYSPNQNKEYLQSKTELNVINAKEGNPIKNPRGEVTGSNGTETGPQTTLLPGSIGTTNQRIVGSLATEAPVFKTFSLETANKIKKSKLETSDNINNTKNSQLISLNDSPSDGLMNGIYKGENSNNREFEPRSTYTGYRTEDNINTLRFLEDPPIDPDGAIPIRVNGKFDAIKGTSRPIPLNDLNSGDYSGLISTIPGKSRGAIEDFRSQGQTEDIPLSSTEFTGRQVTTYAFDYTNTKINKETRVKLGNPGKINRSRINYRIYDEDTVDKLNKLGVKETPLDGFDESRDLIQLEFQIVTPEKTFYLGFRAFLDTFDDSFNASWDSHKYLGRAENFYTYGGFERTINIGFKIAAQSRAEMQPLYEKAATLASVTAPTYAPSGKFMRGTIAKVTVGDYIYEQPGIIESVQYTWNKDYPWEISFQNPEGVRGEQILPHVLDVNLSFKVIHDFLPTTGVNPLITNYRAETTRGNKKTYIPLVRQEVIKPKTDNEQKIDESTENQNNQEVEQTTVTSVAPVLPAERPTVAIDKTFVDSPKFNPNKDFKLNLQNFNSDNNFKINTSNQRETPKLNLTEEQRATFAEFGITSFIND